MNEIKEMLKPETQLEEAIMDSPEFIEGVMHGKPRPGHPEGKVLYHVREVLDNVSKYSTASNRRELRLIALIHDTFKNKVDGSLPKSGENHHGMIARRFAERFIHDLSVLNIIELHDEAHNAHRKLDVNRAKRLVSRLGSSLETYLIFFKCDNETGDKEQDNIKWFEKLAKE